MVSLERYEGGKNRLIFGKKLFDVNLANLIRSKQKMADKKHENHN